MRHVYPRWTARAFANPPPTLLRRVTRPLSTTAAPASATHSQKPTATASLSPRWLSDLKTRIGKCIMFGLSREQTQEASSVLEEIALDWRGLVAGSEGFLTDKNRRGLYRQEVVWGEMHGRTISLDVTFLLRGYEWLNNLKGHVNNVMYNRYAESARVNWTLNFANLLDPVHKKEWKELVTPSGIGLILRSIRTDYKFPMKWPDHITVLHRLSTKPQADTDHFILDVLILSELHQRPAARCVEDIVVYDYKQAKKAPLKPFMVEKFKETWDLQEQAKKTYGARVTDLIRRVRELEKASWDRADAKEDFGSAGQ